MRAIIAERMLESVRVSPHVYTVYKVDMTRIARLREQRKANFDHRHHVKLTFMCFIAAVAVAVLLAAAPRPTRRSKARARDSLISITGLDPSGNSQWLMLR